jgi:CBS domain containing-hemolysin-like protein
MAHATLIWSLFAVCLAVSFVLSGMEAGVFALSRLRIRQRMRAGLRSAKVLYGYLEHPENFLWTILVGNTLANFLILGWLAVNLHRALAGHRLAFLLVFTPLVLLFYALFDLLPKMLFRANPNQLCLFMARPFRVVHLLLSPLVALVESVSGVLLRWRGGRAFTGYLFGNREELRQVMQESAQALTSEERVMINRVLDLQALTVRQTMKPLAQVVTVAASAPLSEAFRLCRQHQLSRLPVREEREGRQRIVGLLPCNTLLYEASLDTARPAGSFVRPALYLEEDLRLEVALRRMQRGGQRLGIVLGRDRRESGILTLHDVLKAMFGEVAL